MKRINERVIQLNDAEPNPKAKYVLYWMQMYKRTTHNHSLVFAINWIGRGNADVVERVGEFSHRPPGD